MIQIARKWVVSAADVRAFAQVVGDFNPVHHDADFAAKTRFKTPIAHGMTALAMLNHQLPKQFSLQSFTVRFHKPIYPGDSLTS